MAFTYRLSRRLAQIHLTSIVFLTISCADTQSPSFDAEYSNTDNVSISGATVLTSLGALTNLNEPPGFSVISDRTLNAKVESGWTDRGDQAFSIIGQSTAPRSPNSVGQALFRKGYQGGGGPIATDLNLRGKKKKQVYVSFWLKLSTSFVGAPSSGVNKVYHIWADGKSTVVFALFGQGSSTLKPQLRLQSMEADPRGVSFNLIPNVLPGSTVARNTWYHFEIQLVANTPGLANGKALLWVNGALAGSFSNVGYLGTNDSAYWEQVSWAPTWGTPKDKVSADMYMYMDHIYVSGK